MYTVYCTLYTVHCSMYTYKVYICLVKDFSKSFLYWLFVLYKLFNMIYIV